MALTAPSKLRPVAPEPVVRLFEPVEADGDGVHAGCQQRVQPCAVEQQSVGDDSPGIFAFVQFPSAYFDIFTHQRFASGKDDHHLMRVHMGRNLVYHFQEIFDRHIRMGGRNMAVASAMEAGGVTTKRTLPKERTQFMNFGPVLPDASE